MSAPEASPTAPLPGSPAGAPANPSAEPDPTLLAAFADTLLPGDDRFPAASVVGAHGLLAERLRLRLGGEGLDRVASALSAASPDGPFASAGDAERTAAVDRLAAAEPELFALLRTILYYSYYQSPLVVRAVRALGWDYNDAPQPLGYHLPPFDPTPGANLPAIPRGAYKRTEAMSPLDLTALEGTDPTTPPPPEGPS